MACGSPNAREEAPVYLDQREPSCGYLKVEAGGRELKHCLGLLSGDSGKPFDELIAGCAVLEVFEECPHLHSRIATPAQPSVSGVPCEQQPRHANRSCTTTSDRASWPPLGMAGFAALPTAITKPITCSRPAPVPL